MTTGQPSPRSPDALVAAALSGDEAAARALFARLHPLVLKLVRAHAARFADEDDLVQAVFTKIFSKLGQYSGAAPIEHWVSRVVVNTCLNQLKHERIRPELRWSDLKKEEEIVLERLGSTDPASSPAEQVAARDLVERLLDSLNPADRLVVTLLHLEERSVVEVRAVTGWSTAMVKIRAFRARRKLRKRLHDLMQEARPALPPGPGAGRRGVSAGILAAEG